MDDLISRKQAIDALDKHIDTFDAIDKNYLSGLRTAMSILKEMPSAQPDSMSGCWIVKEGETAFWDICSNCGEKTIHRMPHFKYCPYCGRRMEVV